MTSRGQCPRGGVRLVFHPSKFRPPPTWLAGYGPGRPIETRIAQSKHNVSPFATVKGWQIRMEHL